MFQHQFIDILKREFNIKLNEQQIKAVLHLDGALLLIAVPGAGKTTVMVCRCANMILNHNIKPENILTLTFSKAAANDMKEKFYKLFGKHISYDVGFSTIHSFCRSVVLTYSQMRNKEMPTIIETKNLSVNKYFLLKQIYFKVNNEYLGEEGLDELVNNIGFVKNMMLNAEQFKDYDLNIKNFNTIFQQYEEYKKTKNFMDFDDMLTFCFEILVSDKEILNYYREKFKYINLDEAQDTSKIQHEIVKILRIPQ